MAYRSTGAAGATTGAGGNPTGLGLPAGHVANDILELVIHLSDNIVCSVNQGYTLEKAVNNGATNRQEVWWKRDGGSEVVPTITHTGGDSCIARIHAFSGRVTSGNPHTASTQNGTLASKTATSTTLTPAVNDDILFAVTAAENVSDTSGGTQGWSTYSGTNPTFTERGDTFDGAGLRDLNGAEATGGSTDGSSTGARTAVEGWSYAASTTGVIAGMFALAQAGSSVTVIATREPNRVGPTSRSFMMLQRLPVVPAVAVDVTIALTGVAATSAVGALGVLHDNALAGVSSTSAAGTLAPSTTVALTGVSSTSSAGSVSPSTTVTLTGASSTTAAGTLAPSTTIALTGVASTASAGLVAPSFTLILTGVGSTTSVGTVAPSTTVALLGVTATGAVGTVVASGGDVTPSSASEIIFLLPSGKLARRITDKIYEELG